MLSFTVLGSGSAGNCAVVATENCKLLIDAGLSARQILLRLEMAGIAPEQLDGILLTHEHCDHICGLKVLCRKYDIPIYVNRQTADVLKSMSLCDHRNWQIFTTGQEFSVKDITIETFAVPHDAVEPVGFALHHGGASLGVVTDLGTATKLVLERVRRVSAAEPCAARMHRAIAAGSSPRPAPTIELPQGRASALAATPLGNRISDSPEDDIPPASATASGPAPQ